MIDNSLLMDKAKKLPEIPGVYIMRDSNEIIIYIGKAKNLKNRVTSYFYNLKDRSSKIEKLILNIKDFEYLSCDNEFDALILENRLIKKHKPRYNSLLKNTLKYPYIVIDKQRGYYNISWEYEIDKEYEHVFGPFNSRKIVERYIEMINGVYKLKRCSEYRKNKCLEYHLKNCTAPCSGEITQDEYNKNFTSIIEHLEGISESVIKDAEREMMKAAEELDFKKAQELRDLIYDVKGLENGNNVIKKEENQGDKIYVLPTIEGNKKAYMLRNLNIIGTELIEDIDENNLEILKDRFYNNITCNEVALDSLRNIIDEKIIVYNYISKEGNLYKID